MDLISAIAITLALGADRGQAAPREAARAGHGPTRTRGGLAGAKEQRRCGETRAPPGAPRISDVTVTLAA